MARRLERRQRPVETVPQGVTVTETHTRLCGLGLANHAMACACCIQSPLPPPRAPCGSCRWYQAVIASAPSIHPSMHPPMPVCTRRARATGGTRLRVHGPHRRRHVLDGVEGLPGVLQEPGLLLTVGALRCGTRMHMHACWQASDRPPSRHRHATRCMDVAATWQLAAVHLRGTHACAAKT